MVESSVAIASRAGLRAYDGIYLAMALRAGAALVTLDCDLAYRARRHLPEVDIRCDP